MRVKYRHERWWGVGVYSFECPGCKFTHFINTDPRNPAKNKEKSVWGFNGNMDRPTFTPSILFRVGKYVPDLTPEQITHAEEMGPESNLVCHSYVMDGIIKILPDSTFNGGKSFELPFVLSNKRKL